MQEYDVLNERPTWDTSPEENPDFDEKTWRGQRTLWKSPIAKDLGARIPCSYHLLVAITESKQTNARALC
jgi:hypothetical protein